MAEHLAQFPKLFGMSEEFFRDGQVLGKSAVSKLSGMSRQLSRDGRHRLVAIFRCNKGLPAYIRRPFLCKPINVPIWNFDFIGLSSYGITLIPQIHNISEFVPVLVKLDASSIQPH
jgi:hypothetical protein